MSGLCDEAADEWSAKRGAKFRNKNNCNYLLFMMKVSVVTVTMNNADGLSNTLRSLVVLQHVPYEVVVVDGQSSDATADIVTRYQKKLNITFISEADEGIYHAMNKGLRSASGKLVHYLNAGDTVYGEPYCGLADSSLLPVQLVKDGCFSGYASLTIAGHSYCHQGIIFSADHQPYDQRYSIAADFALLLDQLPDLSALPWHRQGGVRYDLSGVSSRRRFQRDKEIAIILWRAKKWSLWFYFICLWSVKSLAPNSVRKRLHKKCLPSELKN